MKEKVKSGAKKTWWVISRHSATIVWARIVVIVGLVAETLNASAEFSPFVHEMFSPRWAYAALIVVGIVSELARSRTLNKPKGGTS